MSTRRVAVDDAELRFDHGAQYFTVRDDRFAQQVSTWQAAGIAAPWPVAGDDAFVGTPAMNAPVKAMTSDQDVRFAARIDALDHQDGQWRLIGQVAEDEEPFDAVIVAIPAEQAAALIGPHDKAIGEQADNSASRPCWTVMAHYAQPLPIEDTYRGDGGPIGWAARNNAKPERDAAECWVLQGSPEWSHNHLEDDHDSIEAAVLAAFAARVDSDLPDPVYASAHRWRFAMSGSAGGPFWNAECRLGACGDWTTGPRVEDAWLSGQRLADKLLG